MDFDAIVKKYNSDDATEEEIAFVEDTVYHAREIGKTRLRGDKHVSFGQKVKRFFITLGIILGIVAVMFIAGYFYVSSIARDNMVVTNSGAQQVVYEFADHTFGAGTEIEISSHSRQLVVTLPLSRSYYLYQYKITVAGKGAYKITIDSYSQLVEYTEY